MRLPISVARIAPTRRDPARTKTRSKPSLTAVPATMETASNLKRCKPWVTPQATGVTTAGIVINAVRTIAAGATDVQERLEDSKQGNQGEGDRRAHGRRTAIP